MPTLLTPAPVEAATPQPRRKRWTRHECVALESSGLLDQQHFELVEGELIDKMGKNSPHVTSLIALVLWLQQAFGAQFVRFEAPIDVSPDDNEKNEPEPDAVVLKREYFHFATRNPQPRDLQLVVEVSDSSLAFDLTTKAALYARAEIAEYWVLDVNRRRLIVHRTPADGKYHSVEVYGENESVSPLAAATAEFRPVYAFPASVQ